MDKHLMNSVCIINKNNYPLMMMVNNGNYYLLSSKIIFCSKDTICCCCCWFVLAICVPYDDEYFYSDVKYRDYIDGSIEFLFCILIWTYHYHSIRLEKFEKF